MSEYQFGKFKTEVDVTDVAFVERYEAMAETYNEEMQAVPKDGKASQQMAYIVQVFTRAFDRLFGEGTSKLMFGDTRSVDLCVQAFRELVRMMGDYTKTIERMQISVPSGRTEKRAAKKK